MSSEADFRSALATCAGQLLVAHNALEDAASFIRGDIRGRSQRDGILRQIDLILKRRAASAIEAQRAATAETGAVHEHAVPNGETPQ